MNLTINSEIGSTAKKLVLIENNHRHLRELLSKAATQAKSFLLFSVVVYQTPTKSPDIVIKGFKSTELVEGKKTLELKAKIAQLHKEQQIGKLYSPQLKFWSTAGKEYYIQAEEGLFNNSKDIIQLQTNVHIKTPEDQNIFLEHIVYSSELKQFESDSRVHFEGKTNNSKDQLQINANGLFIDSIASTIKLTGKTTTRQNSNGKEVVKIFSDSAYFKLEDKKIEFLDRVAVETKNAKLSGDKLNVFLDTDQNRIKNLVMLKNKDSLMPCSAEVFKYSITSNKIEITMGKDKGLNKLVATGHVKIKENKTFIEADQVEYIKDSKLEWFHLKGNTKFIIGKRKAQSDEAKFYPKTGKIILIGVAIVKEGNNKLQGKRITISTKSSDINVEEASGTIERNSIDRRQF